MSTKRHEAMDVSRLSVLNGNQCTLETSISEWRSGHVDVVNSPQRPQHSPQQPVTQTAAIELKG